jgi:hypothetical protein
MGGLERNLRTGMGYGVAYAAVYSAFVLVLALVVGERLFAGSGTSLVRVVFGYVAAGVGGGLVVGLLLPLGGTKLGAALVGFVAAIPVFFAFGMGGEPQPPLEVLLLDALPLAAIMGAPAGLIIRSQFGGGTGGLRRGGRTGRHP